MKANVLITPATMWTRYLRVVTKQMIRRSVRLINGVVVLAGIEQRVEAQWHLVDTDGAAGC